MLEARNLACLRDERLLFRALSFRVSPGEVVHLTGANGAGKTSLLRLLVGLARPEEGEVYWRGEPLAHQRSAFHQELLWLGHLPGIKVALTADENLAFYHPQTRREARWQSLAAIGLGGYEDLPVEQLSAGQQRRVALARLWLSEASLWVLDEPLTALDAAGMATLTRRLEAHAARGGAVIVTTHQPLALNVVHRTLTLTPEPAA
ncbi:cytochrome c biogenesis heme-transporting ATPase CcmA [Cronobacter sakazakii]|uniref:cytochrome c biogenesis heme-transporting ATPase CcmA n=1 Tax=Cronobacter sakazakii TaxID=28141 RepID=UPI00020F34ED|nr:cytochrome c biogenesis heme-transporting ATPase CcmA [Cronobacter sakazakii]EGL73412.1 cytochrome c biogenesis protein CcmA [Cronobacter sakazakii E899]MDK1224390.1 cytochrome c biogenesis heme-transporting ATPase CcmA [Cronobacter turicensis]CCK03450.1 ABC transporter involved in cytochrome c biogenesis, ATPase component CcmA [Cronobacter sakazakii 701]AFJ98699.1 cytochrome c biogenesis protein CcmA [Cronobacter sakazakii ES15]AGE85480.1 cytochrome c biogenesis protein CcmA [Cronobacter s